MKLIDIKNLYDTGQVTKVLQAGDTFLVGRPNSQRGDLYSVLAIDQGDLVSQISANIPVVLPYKVYTALLTQTGTENPIATVLQNTLGGIVVWRRTSAGSYEGRLAEAFPLIKTWNIIAGVLNVTVMSSRITDVNTILVDTNATDGILNSTSLEIKVYN